MFEFITIDDSHSSFVNYVDNETALQQKLFKILPNNSIHIGVDTINKVGNNGRGRNSVRIKSRATYNHGLFVIDLAHMPGSICGTYPTFYLEGTTQSWLENGQMVIIQSTLNTIFICYKNANHFSRC